MHRTTVLAALVTFALLALAGAAMYAWLAWRMPQAEFHLRVYRAIACAMAPLVFFPLVAAWVIDDPQAFAVRCFVVLMFGPALLLWWGLEQMPGPAPSSAPAPAVERPANLPESLFAGAITSGESSTEAMGLRYAMFPDHYEVRLLRFNDAGQASRYREAMQSAQQARPFEAAGRSGLELMPTPSSPRVTIQEQHGADLLQVSGPDVPAITAWLAARGVPPPPRPGSWRPVTDDPGVPAPAGLAANWPLAIAWCVVQVIAFLGVAAWLGVATTTVAPPKGVTAASEPVLRARIDALAELGLPLAIRSGEASGELVVDYRDPRGPKRAHRYALRFDAGTRVVRVREFEGAYGDAPRTAEEADMRPGVVHPLEARPYPPADKIWNAEVSASPITAEQLAAIPLRVAGGSGIEWPGDARTVDGDALGHALAAVITRSGWTWQPVFFWFQG
ncbi:MAG TPA: hypothetical protein VJM11_01915 [Nevskiaceae bacterium]|nr:hypothetical protein [Nevskiaceae bacterium]